MESYAQYLSRLWRPPLGRKDPPGFVCLNHNEAPFSGAAGLHVDLASLHRYPEPFPLYQKLARLHDVHAEQILLTFGSEQGLRHVFETFVEPGDRVVMPDPTFGMTEVFRYQQRAEAVRLAYDERRTLDVEKLLGLVDRRTRLVYLANPDNPTGAACSLAAIEAIAARCAAGPGTMLLLDEAYHAYLPLGTLALVARYPCLILARSFSKDWGLAGLRAGYLLAQAEVITLLRKRKPMDELSAPAVEICLQALDHPEIVERNVAQVGKWKQVFRSRGWRRLAYLHSEGNSILMRSAALAAHQTALAQEHILARSFEEPCLRECLRFSVASDDVMEQVVAVLDGVDAE